MQTLIKGYLRVTKNFFKDTINLFFLTANLFWWILLAIILLYLGNIWEVSFVVNLVNKFHPTSIEKGYFYSLAALVGTFLVLLPTLSMIPIQRAAEAWSPLLVNLYKEDPRPKIIFSYLGTLCLFFFWVSNFDQSFLLFTLSILLTAFAIDCIRYYYEFVCDLLDPFTACKILKEKVHFEIDNIQKKTSHYVDTTLLDGPKVINPLEIERNFYKENKGLIKKAINKYTESLEEIGRKAAQNKDARTTRHAIDCLIKIAFRYTFIRHSSFNIEEIPIVKWRVSRLIFTDIQGILGPIYQTLLLILVEAIRNKDEKIIMNIWWAFTSLFSRVLPFDAMISEYKRYFMYETLDISELERILSKAIQQDNWHYDIGYDCHLILKEIEEKPYGLYSRIQVFKLINVQKLNASNRLRILSSYLEKILEDIQIIQKGKNVNLYIQDLYRFIINVESDLFLEIVIDSYKICYKRELGNEESKLVLQNFKDFSLIIKDSIGHFYRSDPSITKKTIKILWELKKAAISLEDTDMIKFLEQKPKNISEDKWKEIEAAINAEES